MKKNFCLGFDPALVEKIDAAAIETGISRQHWMARACEKELEQGPEPYEPPFTVKRASSQSIANPNQDELRRSMALVCSDALRNTNPLPVEAQEVLQATMRRLALDSPLTVEDERDLVRRLLGADAHLTAPYNGRWLRDPQV